MMLDVLSSLRHCICLLDELVVQLQKTWRCSPSFLIIIHLLGNISSVSRFLELLAILNEEAIFLLERRLIEQVCLGVLLMMFIIRFGIVFLDVAAACSS